MTPATEFTISRHAAQKLMHWALTASPRPCRGLLAGHGPHIDDAMLLAGEAGEAAATLSRQGQGLVGWFHSCTDRHDPDPAEMAALEAMPLPSAGPDAALHLLVALDMKGRLELHPYLRDPAGNPARASLRLVDDTPLYLDASRR